MASLEDIRNSRLAKLKALEKEGIDPYPAESERDLTCLEAAEDFEKFSKNTKNNY